jgi:hypothetical protein
MKTKDRCPLPFRHFHSLPLHSAENLHRNRDGIHWIASIPDPPLNEPSPVNTFMQIKTIEERVFVV